MQKTMRLALSGLFAGSLLLAGVKMYQRAAGDLLWGHWPLLLFIGGWGLLVLLVFSRKARAQEEWRWLAYCTLSGVLAGLAFPDVLPKSFLLFGAFIPLLWVERSLHEQGKSWKTALFYAYHTFVVWNIIGTYWVANSALPAGLFAVLVNSALMCIPFMLFRLTRTVMPGVTYGALLTFWLCFEYLHHNWELTWPWLTLGNAFADLPGLIQWYSYTGTLGGSMWAWMLNIYGFLALRAWKKNEAWLGKGMQFALTLLLPLGVSLYMYSNYEPRGRAVEVSVVQPNYEPHFEKFTVPEAEQIDRIIELSKQVLTDSTSYLLFPETSFGFLETDNMNEYPAIFRLRRFLQDYPNVQLVAGVDAYRILQEGDTQSRATREREENGVTTLFEVYNGAIQLGAQSTTIPFYKKSKLVPGPEIFPYPQVFFFMKPLVDQLGGTTAGVGTQPERMAFESKNGKVAPVICYESVFGAYMTGYIAKGAEAIFVLTNDGWWDKTAGHRQHMHYARLRAIEFRRPVARAANTGISCFINQRGDIEQQTAYGEVAAISGSMSFSKEITFYARWRDIIGRFAMFISLMFLLNAFVKRKVKI